MHMSTCILTCRHRGTFIVHSCQGFGSSMQTWTSPSDLCSGAALTCEFECPSVDVPSTSARHPGKHPCPACKNIPSLNYPHPFCRLGFYTIRGNPSILAPSRIFFLPAAEQDLGSLCPSWRECTRWSLSSKVLTHGVLQQQRGFRQYHQRFAMSDEGN